jgi:hypothetical protein
MLTEIPRLTPLERLLLLEALSRSLREDLMPDADQHTEREAAVERLFGVLKPATGQPPSDAELQDDYNDYLSEKYS